MTDNDLHSCLVSSLTARLDRARAATPGPWFRVGPPWNDGTPWINAGSQDPHHKRFVCDLDDMSDWDDDMDASGRSVVADASYIAANAPDAEIRRIEATLREAWRHVPEPGQHPDFCGYDRHELPCPTLVDLAAGEGIEP